MIVYSNLRELSRLGPWGPIGKSKHRAIVWIWRYEKLAVPTFIVRLANKVLWLGW